MIAFSKKRFYEKNGEYTLYLSFQYTICLVHEISIPVSIEKRKNINLSIYTMKLHHTR